MVNKTLALLNQGEGLHDLGISDERAAQLVAESDTIGVFISKVRRDLTSNQQQLAGLTRKEACRAWIVVLAGNEPDGNIDGLTRGTMSSAVIDRMLSVTTANVVSELKQFPEKLGMLGTYLDARVLHVPVLAALAAVRTYASDEVRRKMKDAGMTVAP
jgi:DNA (cytosine-5)-methyltransferase 1